MGLAMDAQVVDVDVEAVAHLAGGAGEGDVGFGGGNVFDDEAFGFEPGGDGGDVFVGRPEALAEVRRGEPLVILRQTGVVEAVDEGVQLPLLGGRAAEDEDDVAQWLAVADGAAVVFSDGGGVDVAGERDEPGFVDGFRDATGREGLGELGLDWDATGKGEDARQSQEGQNAHEKPPIECQSNARAQSKREAGIRGLQMETRERVAPTKRNRPRNQERIQRRAG